MTEERDRRAHEQDVARNAALQALAASYQAAERPLPGGLVGRVRRLLIDQIVRPFVAPLVEQQNAHNAAVLRALDALAENADARRSEFYALLDEQEVRLGAIEARSAGAESHLGALDHQIAAINDRLTDLDDNDTLLAERLAALDEAARHEERA